MEKIKLDRPVIVEGKYDKIKLSSVFDVEIIETNGFGIFKSEEKREYIKLIANKKGIIILTDSDDAGAMIRNKIKDFVPSEKIVNLYIPQIKGKEKRKKAPSAEGYLGVEGVDKDVLISVFEKYVTNGDEKERIMSSELYELGLCGRSNSSKMREYVCKTLNIPANLRGNAFLDALNLLCDKNKLTEMCDEYESK